MDLGRVRRSLSERGAVRSFALGGLVGVAGAVATARRLRASGRVGQAAGLSAFETAPCFAELSELQHEQGTHQGFEAEDG
jgi:hypothetical protein